jgi:hypothetical protein
MVDFEINISVKDLLNALKEEMSKETLTLLWKKFNLFVERNQTIREFNTFLLKIINQKIKES